MVLHDTTEFRFGGTKERRGLGRISNKKRDGFLAHYSLCVSLQGDPLGCLELLAWSRLDEDKRPKCRGSLPDPDRESLRWTEAAERTSARLHGKTSPIHVLDREGDQFGLFATLADENERFVVQLGHDRRLRKGRGRDGFPMLNERLAEGTARFTRKVHLGKRERERAAKKAEHFPRKRGARSYARNSGQAN